MKFLVCAIERCNFVAASIEAWYFRRGAGVVTEQIANLSAGNRRLGSSPSLSA